MAEENRPFKLDTSRISNPVLRAGAGLSRPVIERALCFPELNRLYGAASDADGEQSFTDKVLDIMNVKLEVSSQEGFVFPDKGPLVIVANHPFGGIEGLLMISMMQRLRPDCRIMANFILSMMPDIREWFFFVNPFGGAEAKRENLAAMRSSIKWVEEGHALAVFPSGEVSSVDVRTGRVRDPAWSPTIARIIRRTGATVLPVFFSGHNGALFNMAGLIHPRLRTVLLPKQFVNKRNRTIHAEMGQPISPKEMEQYATDEELINFLRLHTYVLGERESAKPPKRKTLLSHILAKQRGTPEQDPIIDPVSPDVLEAEISALPPDALLYKTKEFSVFAARTPQIPECMREIGRLREVTYRAVGEGTNRPLDIDQYDEYYLHIFIWNSATREIIGAYRVGEADLICAKMGYKGLYTASCYKYDDRLLDRIQPALELGRAWVRTEYQRAFSPLLMLWRGICAFVRRNPRYVNLFGPVSISNAYLDASRNLILRSLSLTNFAGDLAKLVRPRHRKMKRPGRTEWNRHDFDPYVGDLDTVSRLVQDIESDQKGIPILMRQYLKLGGRFLAFDVDPDFNFSLDGLIDVELPKSDPKLMARYMGAKEFAEYAAMHGVNVQHDA